MYTTLQAIESYIYTEVTNSYSVFAAVRDIVVNATNPMVTFSYNNISISNDYKGELNIGVMFTSPTTYNVIKTEKGIVTNLYIGTGDITLDFTVNEFTIPAGTFGGAISVNDKIKFTIKRDISHNDLLSIINDVTAEIDSFAKATGRIPWPQMGDVFLSFPYTPREIQVAATMWVVAFMIERRKLNQVLVEGERPYNEILKNSARKKIEQFGIWYGSQSISMHADANLGTAGATIGNTLSDLSGKCPVPSYKDCDDCEPATGDGHE